MPLHLHPGDPVPALDVRGVRLDPGAFRGAYAALVVGTVPLHVPLPVLAIPADATGVVAARRLGADVVDEVPQPLVVLLDPAGVVVVSVAGKPVADLLADVAQRARVLAGGAA